MKNSLEGLITDLVIEVAILEKSEADCAEKLENSVILIKELRLERDRANSLLDSAISAMDTQQEIIKKIKETYILAENIHLLIEESKSTCERNFGKSGLIDWMVSDMHELVNELITDGGEWNK